MRAGTARIRYSGMTSSFRALAQDFITRRSVSSITVPLKGRALLENPYFNKGTAFTESERERLSLRGLLPPNVQTIHQQRDRAYEQYQAAPDNLSKNVFMMSMLEQNIVLFYALLTRHLKEMMPVVYTPTEGSVIENYSHLFRQPSGCFLSVADGHDDDDLVALLKESADGRDIKYLVVSDGEQILGLGDQGVGGILISVAKLILATACGGVSPYETLPVVLDTGTNNDALRSSALYLGTRKPRMEGTSYHEFVDRFVQAARKAFPDVYVHFEDFGVSNAKSILDRYSSSIPCFNDDIQGTGCIVMAAILSGLRAADVDITQARFLVYGAGSAGCGIARQIAEYLAHESNVEFSTACSQIACFDKDGLIIDTAQDEFSEAQANFARPQDEWTSVDTRSLEAVINEFKPHVLIGTSGQAGAFSENIIKAMAEHVSSPVVLPLSNPTRLAEATPKDVLHWTNGKALVATGSPFEPVEYGGKRYEIGECNNSVCFPGIALGAIMSKASRVSSEMLIAAIRAISLHSPIEKESQAGLVPDVGQARAVSSSIASAVITTAQRQGLCQVQDIPLGERELKAWVDSQMWEPNYSTYQFKE